MVYDYAPLIKKNGIIFYRPLRCKHRAGFTLKFDNPWHVVSDYQIKQRHQQQVLQTGAFRANLAHSRLPFSISSSFVASKPGCLRSLQQTSQRFGYLEYPLFYRVAYVNGKLSIQFQGLARSNASTVKRLQRYKYHILGFAFIKYRTFVACTANVMRTPNALAYFAHKAKALLCLAAHGLDVYGMQGPARSGAVQCWLWYNDFYGLAHHRLVTWAPVIESLSYGQSRLSVINTFVYHVASANGLRTVRCPFTEATSDLADIMKPRGVKSSPYVKYYTASDRPRLRVALGSLAWAQVHRATVTLVVQLGSHTKRTFVIPLNRLTHRELNQLGSLAKNQQAFASGLAVLYPPRTSIVILSLSGDTVQLFAFR